MSNNQGDNDLDSTFLVEISEVISTSFIVPCEKLTFIHHILCSLCFFVVPLIPLFYFKWKMRETPKINELYNVFECVIPFHVTGSSSSYGYILPTTLNFPMKFSSPLLCYKQYLILVSSIKTLSVGFYQNYFRVPMDLCMDSNERDSDRNALFRLPDIKRHKHIYTTGVTK